MNFSGIKDSGHCKWNLVKGFPAETVSELSIISGMHSMGAREKELYYSKLLVRIQTYCFLQDPGAETESEACQGGAV